MGRAPQTLTVAVRSYLIGSIPFAGLVARLARDVDLRTVDTGTVSGTGLYRVAGWQLLFLGGTLDLAKGMAAVLLVEPRARGLRSLAGIATVAGHNWSVFLSGAGGRGLSPALGVTTVLAPEATAVLGAGLAAGRLSGETALGSFVAQALMPVVLGRRGKTGVALGLGLTGVMWAKRLAGNEPPAEPGLAVYLRRLLYDRD